MQDDLSFVSDVDIENAEWISVVDTESGAVTELSGYHPDGTYQSWGKPDNPTKVLRIKLPSDSRRDLLNLINRIEDYKEFIPHKTQLLQGQLEEEFSEGKIFRKSYGLYTPRRGRVEPISLSFNMFSGTVAIDIAGPCFYAKFRMAFHGNPIWTGYNAGLKSNPLMKLFSNEHIQTPSRTPNHMMGAWEKWRENRVEAEQLDIGLRKYFNWLSKIQQHRPKGKLWRGLF